VCVVTARRAAFFDILTPPETPKASHSRITQEPVTLFGARGEVTVFDTPLPAFTRSLPILAPGAGSVLVGEISDFHVPGLSLELEHESSTPQVIHTFHSFTESISQTTTTHANSQTQTASPIQSSTHQCRRFVSRVLFTIWSANKSICICAEVGVPVARMTMTSAGDVTGRQLQQHAAAATVRTSAARRHCVTLRTVNIVDHVAIQSTTSSVRLTESRSTTFYRRGGQPSAPTWARERLPFPRVFAFNSRQGLCPRPCWCLALTL